jgi:hypothetical protein
VVRDLPRLLLSYQELFLTPGILPSLANSLKQILQRPKSRIKPLPRAHRKHRLVAFVLNFGFFAARAFTDVFAIENVIKKAFSSWGYTTNTALKSQRQI